MPQSPHSIPPGKGGKPHGKKSQSISQTKNGLTVHSWIPLSSKFTGKILLFKSSLFGKVTANHADFMHFAHSPREFREIRYKIHPH